MPTKIHPIAGIIGFLTILCFWSATIFSETLGTHAMVASVKGLILIGMFVLIPAMIIVGASGMSMGRRRKDTPARAKIKRMPVIALNGLLILLPSAIYLQTKAVNGEFDTNFFAVQALELVSGAVNLTLMALSIRDGREMGHRRRLAAP